MLKIDVFNHIFPAPFFERLKQVMTRPGAIKRWLRIPMFNAQARSLNLSNCVSLVLFEALRQQGFAGELDGEGSR